MHQAGASTLRAWAFLDVEAGQNRSGTAFQIFSPGAVRINEAENGLVRLDSLIANAEVAGIALLLPLINGWSDFGGMPLYAKAFGAGPEAESFYTCSAANSAYRNWVERLLTRRNTRTGRFYAEEPSILAWELANEPRHTGPGGGRELLEWIAKSSGFIKRIDRNHLLAVGDEGFFGKRGRSHLYDGRYGGDAEAFLRLDTIDFGTYHFYPDHWGVPIHFAGKWIRDHAELARAAGKPVVLEEFGIARTPLPNRLARYQDWMRLASESGSAGALLWMIGSTEPDAAQYRDRYTLRTVSNR